MSRFDIIATPLSGLVVLLRKPIQESRGMFERLFCLDELRRAGLGMDVLQINRSITRQPGAVRGMHYQYPPYAETKIVSCTHGRVFDVAIDVRKNSPTFLRWHGEELSEENHRSMLIPPGFAHGFQTLDIDCELIYLHSAPYTPEAEGAVNAGDPCVGIAWPLPLGEMSARDRAHPYVDNSFLGVSI